MPHNLEDARAYAGRWVDLIHRPSLSESEAKAVIEEFDAQLRRSLQ